MHKSKEQKIERRNLPNAQVETLKELISRNETIIDSLFPHRLECDYVTLTMLDLSNSFCDFDYLCDLIGHMLLNTAKLLASTHENKISILEHYQFLFSLQTMFKRFHDLKIDKN